jgi:hypothetical protein
MNRVILATGCMLLLSTVLGMADEIDEIHIIDESSKSSLYNKGPILVCKEHTDKKEESCSKKAEDLILEGLPTSQQLEEINIEDKTEKNLIKDQLSDILSELTKLKKAQKADRETISELKKVIKVLSVKKVTNPKRELHVIKESIKRITAKKDKVYTKTLIRKPIKEISRDAEKVIIEVQSNESLSTYAQYYYNDNTQYYRIYKANQDKMNKNFQITIGSQLLIPLR